MKILCAQCRSPIELTHSSRDTEIACPACGSSFFLEGESTVDWRPRAEQMVGRFKLLMLVGQGAFGMVYKAHDTHLDRVVALKVPRTPQVSESTDHDRFLREARSVARLRHPSILPIYEVGQHDELTYLVTDFLVGITLADLLTTRRPPFREAAATVATIAEALHYAHAQGVVHRDVKPSNIMLDEQGRPFLMDFGLARRDTGEVSITLDGQVVGTPAYMSPEQARGEGHRVDGRSDVYSLGAVLYQLLTGERPFRGNTRMLLHQVLNDEPRPPRSLNDKIPRDLETICLKGMAKTPARRYATAGDLAADLRRFLAGEPIHARPVGRLERGLRWLRRHPLRAALGAMTALALVALAVALVSVAYSQRLGEAYDHEAAARGRAEQAEREAKLAEGTATQARGEVEKALGETRQARDETQQALGLANTHAYFHRIALADAALRENNVERARELLDACPRELRHWEWRHLMQQCSAPLASFRVGGKGDVLRRLQIGPEGRYLAWSNKFGAVTVAEADTGKPIWSRAAPAGQIKGYGLAISPDGRLLAHEGKGGAIEVRKLADGKLLRTVATGGRAGTIALAFAPDSKKLAVAWEIWIGLIDVEQGVYLHTYPGTFGRVGDLHFHPDGKSFVSAHWDHHAWIWGVEGGPPKRTIYCNQGPLYTAQFNPRGTLLATGGLDGSIRLWNAANGQPVATLSGHDFTVRRIAFRPDGLCLASCSSDGTVQAHSLVGKQGRPAVVYRGHAGHVSDVAFHPEGDRLYSAGMDDTVKVWDATTPPGGQVVEGKGGINHIRARFLPGGQHIVTAGLSEAFQVRDTATLSVVRSLRPVPVLGSVVANVGGFKRVAIHPSGQKAVLGAAGFPPEVRDLSTGKILLTLPEALGNWAVLYMPNGRLLLTTGASGSIDVRAADTGKVIRSLTEHKAGVRGLAVSRDGRWLASSGDDHTLLLWNLAKGTVIHRLTVPEKTPSFGTAALAFSPDGTVLASGTPSGKIHLWGVADGRLTQTLPGHLGGVHDLRFHPDGKRLLSGGMDRRARLWDLRTGQEALTLRGATNQVYSVDVDDKGERILVCSGDQVLFVFSGEEPTSAWRDARLVRQKEQLRAWQRRELEQATTFKAWNSVEWLATRLIEAKAGQPSDHAVRALARAEIGRRKEARADLAEAWQHRACPLEVGSLLALLHQEAGDDKAHRAVVADILDRHGDTTMPLLANNIAWNCARFPGAVDDWKQVKNLAVLAAGPEGRRSANGLNTLGAVLYRAGDSRGAIAAIEEGIRLRGTGVLEDWAFLAMAHHKLGQQEAGSWLGKARKALAQRQRLGTGDKTVPVRDLEAMLLVREAVAMLREKKDEK